MNSKFKSSPAAPAQSERSAWPTGDEIREIVARCCQSERVRELEAELELYRVDSKAADTYAQHLAEEAEARESAELRLQEMAKALVGRQHQLHITFEHGGIQMDLCQDSMCLEVLRLVRGLATEQAKAKGDSNG